MKTEIATTQDQSQRLLRCGVPADTADTYWDNHTIDEPFLVIGEVEDERDTPAWSLSALLINILPNSIVIDGIEHVLCVYSGEYKDADPIEISVRMIEWMNENGYKLNEI